MKEQQAQTEETEKRGNDLIRSLFSLFSPVQT
jgi:hypothetical protein